MYVYSANVDINQDSCHQSSNGNTYDNITYKVIMVTVRNDDMTNTGNHNTCDMDICYYSLDKALRHVNSNSIINITIPYDTLLSPANLSNLSNITIAGNSMSEIDCNYTGALVCKGCNNVIIKNIRWIRCGFFNISTTGSNSHNKAYHLDPIGGLYFDTCTNLTIQCCTFLTSLVQISQASETVTISNVYYTDNYTNTYPQSYYEYTYGGLYVEQSNSMDLFINIADCSFTSMKPNGTAIQLFVVKSKDSGMNHILISSTSFTDSINNQPVPSNYGNSMVFINISSSHTNVTLSDVRFQSNTIADNGSILSIVTNEDNSTVQLLSCVFLSNTASNVAVFETGHLTITNSVFKYNNGKSNLILLKYQTSIIASYEGLMFSNNTGGPMLSLNSYNISVSFLESKLQHNTLSSGNGLVMLSDYYNLDVLLAGIKFISNKILTDGSTFYSSSPVMMPTKSNSSTHIPPTHKVAILNVVVFRQSGGGDGAGVYISHSSCDSCEVTGSYTLKESTFNNINNINSIIFYGISNSTNNMVLSDCQFTNNHGTAVVVKADDSGINVISISSTSFVDNINNQPVPSNYGSSIIFISISSSHTNITLSDVRFQSNTIADNGSILSIVTNEDNSTVQLLSCVFLSNTASNVAVFETGHLTITNSVFKYNNGKSNLILLKYQTSIIASYEGLMFSNNTGGPMLSLNSYNISVSFLESKLQHNTLSSGNGLVMLSDYYNLDVLLAGIKFISNKILTDGSTFYSSSPVMMPTKSNSSTHIPPTHKVAILNVVVFRQSGGGDGAGVYISHSSCDSCEVTGSYTLKESTFNNINNINSIIFYGISNSTNNMVLSDCQFTNNHGTAVVVKADDSGINVISISSTSFVDNINNQPVPSNYGSSIIFISISSSHTNITLSDVRFQSNTVADNGNILLIITNEDNSTVQLLSCVFLNNTASNVAVFETGHLTIMNSTNNMVISDCHFTNNLGTAVHLKNSNLVIDEGLTLFENNTAEHGAALYLDLNSKVMFNSNSKLSFVGNEARRYGGAIYCSVSEYNGCYKNVSDILLVQNTTSSIIQFKNNVGSAGGNSVYLNVPQSCDEAFQSESNVTMHTFGEEIVTSPKKLRLDAPARLVSHTNVTILSDMYPTYLIPNIMLGQDITISSCILGYNDKPAGTAPFLISHTENTQRYSINGSRGSLIGCQPSQGISNLQIINKQSYSHNVNSYYSRLNNSGILQDHYSDNDYTVIQLHSFYDTAYELKPIVVNLIIEISPCHSGFYYSDKDEMCICYTTDDIVSCSGSKAAITRGYWFGVVSEQPTVGVCPVNYCDFDKCGEPCALLPSPDKQCGEHRTGTACGNCKDSYTLSFDSVDCVSTINCTTGLTALVVTMTCLYWIFTIVVVFAMMYFKVGIGYLYSITFYYSVIDILLGQALHTSDALYGMVTIVSSLARLTPQFLGQICFVIGLSGIDQQFIHYIHPLAILVILLFISISARFSPRLSLFVSRGVIHVICFLLLLSYTSIASTSLLLIRPLTFTGVNKVFIYLSPDLEYFHGRHLAYGLVAIACGIVIVIGLPLILLLEPFVNHKINFTRIKPLLDQFQGHYQDKYRYFASYYMICRLVMLVIVNVNIANVFGLMLWVAFVLVVHVAIRPYASKILNAVDTLLLLTMMLVTILHLFEASNGITANTITGLAFTLVAFPLLIFLLLFTPFMNRQHIQRFIMSTVKWIKMDEPRNNDIEILNVNQYEVIVDDALRGATATTIA